MYTWLLRPSLLSLLTITSVNPLIHCPSPRTRLWDRLREGPQEGVTVSSHKGVSRVSPRLRLTYLVKNKPVSLHSQLLSHLGNQVQLSFLREAFRQELLVVCCDDACFMPRNELFWIHPFACTSLLCVFLSIRQGPLLPFWGHYCIFSN